MLEVRLIDENGKATLIPSKAIKDRSRRGDLKGATWSLCLILFANAIPKTVQIKQYNRIEIDWILSPTERIEYFRGNIDHKETSNSVEDDGTIRIECFGVLQRAKAYPLDSITVSPSIESGIVKLMGICSTRRYTVIDDKRAGGSETVLGGLSSYGATAGYLQIAKDINYTSFYVKGTPSTGDFYLFNTALPPIGVTWNIDPTKPRYYQFATLDRFIVPYIKRKPGNTYPSVFVLPYGRDWRDLYHTYVADFNTTNMTITPADTTGYIDKLSLYQGEYITVTTSDGVPHILQIGNVSAQGVLTLSSNETMPAAIAAGDPMRLSTTEAYPAWDEHKLTLFGKDSSLSQIWPYPWFDIKHGVGQAIPVKVRDWSTLEDVYASVSPVSYDDSNRAEEVFKSILTSADYMGLFDESEVVTEQTGAFVRNYQRTNTDADQVLKDFHGVLPPNVFIRDNPNGTISIKPYTQKETPDFQLRGVQSIEEDDKYEPYTGVLVVSKVPESGETNQALNWFQSSLNLTNPHQAFSTGSGATATTPANSSLIVFKIPKPSPTGIFPNIDKLKFKAKGLVTIYEASGVYLAGYNFKKVVGSDGGMEVVEIPGDEIAKLAQRAFADTGANIIIQLDYIDNNENGTYEVGTDTPAAISEIEWVVTKQNAWFAGLTDAVRGEASAWSIADNGNSALGSTWIQSDATKRESYRFAPTEYLKRVSCLYKAKGITIPRIKTLEMEYLSQQDCRDYAERHLDVEMFNVKEYRVTALLDPRAELGDTVYINAAGKNLSLFIQAIEDNGGPRDNTANYTLIDYYG
jgi:hypothetical protein